MCGISGFWLANDTNLNTISGQSREDIIHRMTDALSHRGPNGQGVWCASDTALALGHRRLSIIDLSSAANQPMHSFSSRYVIVFNGEIYNFLDLKKNLENTHALSFKTHSDTEVLLSLIEVYGVEKALQQLSGMFAFALYDKHAHNLYLARDRMGEKPLYYGFVGSHFVFASELKSIALFPNFNNAVSQSSVNQLLRYGYIPHPASIYENIQKLKPSHYIEITFDEIKHKKWPTAKPYWSLLQVASEGVAGGYGSLQQETTCLSQADTLLREVVGRQMVSDVPIGAFLSGGIDSSLVTAYMQQNARNPVKTFTIGFHEAAFDEAKYAKAVAKHLGTDHTELYVTPSEAMSVIPLLPEMYDEPFADSSAIPTYLVSKLAKEKVTVCLSGDGGDEIFAGYTRYAFTQRLWRYLNYFPLGVRRILQKMIWCLPPRHWDKFISVLKFLHLHFAGITGDRLHKLGGILSFSSPEKLYENFIVHWQNLGEPVEEVLIPQLAASGFDFIEKMMLIDSVYYLPDDILVKVDRASMGVSLETRAPFLSPELITFAWQLPQSMKIQNGTGKRILKTLLHRYVPKELVERPKMGFGVPLDSWLRGPLKEWADSLLNEKALQASGLLQGVPVQEKWQAHLGGERNYQSLLWNVLMFQAWLLRI